MKNTISTQYRANGGSFVLIATERATGTALNRGNGINLSQADIQIAGKQENHIKHGGLQRDTAFPPLRPTSSAELKHLVLFPEEINKKTAQSAFPGALSQFSKQVLVPKASVGVQVLPPAVAFLLISMAAEHLCYRL